MKYEIEQILTSLLEKDCDFFNIQQFLFSNILHYNLVLKSLKLILLEIIRLYFCHGCALCRSQSILFLEALK